MALTWATPLYLFVQDLPILWKSCVSDSRQANEKQIQMVDGKRSNTFAKYQKLVELNKTTRIQWESKNSMNMCEIETCVRFNGSSFSSKKICVIGV